MSFFQQITAAPALPKELLTPSQVEALQRELERLTSGEHGSFIQPEENKPFFQPLLEKLLEQSDQIAFFLHRRQTTYQESFFQGHSGLILIAYRILLLQVQQRLDKALAKRVRSGPLKEQIAAEKAEIEKIREEIDRIQCWNPQTPWSQQLFFHYKGIFYHVCTLSQRLLGMLKENSLQQSGLKEALLITRFYRTFLEEYEI